MHKPDAPQELPPQIPEADFASEAMAPLAGIDETTANLAREHLMTPANLMTFSRALLGVALPRYMARGGKHAGALVALGALTDREGDVARWVDSKGYEGWGSTSLGARIDPIADTVFGAGIAAGITVSPNASRTVKLASAINGIKVAKQSAWAIAADKKHREVTGEAYVAKVDKVGKRGTALMLASEGAAAVATKLSSEKPSQAKARKALEVTSVVLAGAGLIFGEQARRSHDKKLKAKLAAYKKPE